MPIVPEISEAFRFRRGQRVLFLLEKKVEKNRLFMLY